MNNNINNKKLILFKAKVKDTFENQNLQYEPNTWVVGYFFGMDTESENHSFIIPLGKNINSGVEILPYTLCEFTGWVISQDIYSGPDEGMNRIPLVDYVFDVANQDNIDILSKVHIDKDTGIVKAIITESEIVESVRKDRFDENKYIDNITLEFIFTNDILKSDYGIAIVEYGHFCDTDYYDEFEDPYEMKGYYIQYLQLAEDNPSGDKNAQSTIYPYAFDYFTIVDNDFNKHLYEEI